MPSSISTRRFRPFAIQSGFTLIELMIVVVVIAVIAMVALPAYQGQVRKARRSEAVAMSAQVQQAQERWRANQPLYATLLMTANPADCDTLAEQVANSCLNIPAVAGARYTYALSGNTATNYTLTATAIAGSSQVADRQSGVACNVLSLVVTNGVAVRNPPACWSN